MPLAAASAIQRPRRQFGVGGKAGLAQDHHDPFAEPFKAMRVALGSTDLAAAGEEFQLAAPTEMRLEREKMLEQRPAAAGRQSADRRATILGLVIAHPSRCESTLGLRRLRQFEQRIEIGDAFRLGAGHDTGAVPLRRHDVLCVPLFLGEARTRRAERRLRCGP
jgi:hypothetical protein